MLDSPFLDLAVTLTAIYFLLGLITSSVKEIIDTVLRTRAKDLKKAIDNLLFDTQWPAIAEKIYASPFLLSLQKEKDRFPPYIPSRNFSLAMLEVIKNGYKDPLSVDKIRELINADDSLIQGDAKRLLLTLLDHAHGNLEKFIHDVEKFYDDAMERLSGRYKRKVRKILLLIAFIIAGALNVDSIHLVKTYWRDQRLLSEAANIAVEYTKEKDLLHPVSVTDSSRRDTIFQRIVGETNKIVQVNYKIKQMSVPLGWFPENIPDTAFSPWLLKVVGWILTAIAISLGAPFWFDMLNKLGNVRANKKPEKAEHPPEKKTN